MKTTLAIALSVAHQVTIDNYEMTTGGYVGTNQVRLECGDDITATFDLDQEIEIDHGEAKVFDIYGTEALIEFHVLVPLSQEHLP
jgi:hypothetical protein